MRSDPGVLPEPSIDCDLQVMSLTFLASGLNQLDVSPMNRHAWVGAKVSRHWVTQKVTLDFRHSQNVMPFGALAFSNKTNEKSMLG